jgi:phosphoglycerate dehydrogenase-like enzyme
MPKLLIASRLAPQYQALIEAAQPAQLEIVNAPAQDVEIVFGEPNLIRELLPALPALKWVQATWAGVEPLLDPALRRDYTLTNARGVFGELMTEYVLAYLLYHERKIQQRLDSQKQARWDGRQTGSLRGKTIGILGVGSIGAHLAASASLFGMRVHGFTRSSENCAQVHRYFHDPHILEFASGLDFLVSILPNTSSTRKMINADLLASLPAQAVLINAGRGSAVEEAALIEALEHDRLALAVLDVFEQEPLPAAHPFWQTKNLLITSHTAAPSLPGDLARVFLENYPRHLAGLPLNYCVDFERGY